MLFEKNEVSFDLTRFVLRLEAHVGGPQLSE